MPKTIYFFVILYNQFFYKYIATLRCRFEINKTISNSGIFVGHVGLDASHVGDGVGEVGLGVSHVGERGVDHVGLTVGIIT